MRHPGGTPKMKHGAPRHEVKIGRGRGWAVPQHKSVMYALPRVDIKHQPRGMHVSRKRSINWCIAICFTMMTDQLQ